MVSMNEREYFENKHATELAISHLNRSFGAEVVYELGQADKWNDAVAMTKALRSGENPVQPQDQLPVESFGLTAEQIAKVEAHREARRAEVEAAMAHEASLDAPDPARTTHGVTKRPAPQPTTIAPADIRNRLTGVVRQQ